MSVSLFFLSLILILTLLYLNRNLNHVQFYVLILEKYIDFGHYILQRMITSGYKKYHFDTYIYINSLRLYINNFTICNIYLYNLL